MRGTKGLKRLAPYLVAMVAGVLGGAIGELDTTLAQSVSCESAIVSECGGSSSSSAITAGTTTITGGTNTRVVFNDSGVWGEDAGLTYVKATDILTALGGYEIGHASDTTLTRVSAGVAAVEGATIATLTASQTFTQIMGFSTTVQFSGSTPAFTVTDGNYSRWGTSGAYGSLYMGLATVPTPDAPYVLTPTTSRSIHIIEGGDETYDFQNCSAGTSASTNPMLCVHSALQDTTHWISFYNDQTNGVIDVGAGVVSIPDGITTAGTIVSSRTSDIGWSVVAGANTACNTTCTNACVFGIDTAATNNAILACTDAAADSCLCAGSN